MKRNAVCRIMLSVLCLMLVVQWVPEVRAAEPDIEGAYHAIVASYDQLLAGDVTVDLRGYQITVEQLDTLVPRSAAEGLQPWYLASYSYKYDSATRIVSTVTFKLRDPEEYDYDLYEQRIAEILQETLKPDMSQWQIALALHDYLVANCSYDETLTYYSAYDAIVRENAVCNGYALAYMDLLTRAGIECVKVSSKEMDHAWNLVKIGENWLHVDVTWDDPVSDRQGRVLHKYFLISDSAISDEEYKHYGWETNIKCDFTDWDTKRFWHDIESQIIFESRDVCYLRDQTGKTGYTVYRRDSETGDLSKITSCDAGYIDIGGDKNKDYFYRNNGLSYYEGRLYYSDMTKVYSIDPDGSGKKTVYAHNYKDNKSYIAGSFVSDGVLYMTLADHDSNQKAMQLELTAPEHSHSYTGETVAADCENMGYDVLTCSCGVSYRGKYTKALGHTYGEGVVIREATYNSKGILRYSCTACGYSYEEETDYDSDPGDPPADAPQEEEDKYAQRFLIGGAILLAVFFLFRKKKK